MTGIEAISDWDLFLIVWYPHSGCRWLRRAMLDRHSELGMSEYFTPWLTHSTDALLALDKTAQVHKSRSLPELANEFEMVKRSVDFARQQGTYRYFEDKKALMEERFPGRRNGGVLPVGSEVSLPDFPMLYSVLPRLRIIHLVRDPYDCFLSLKTRFELDANPHRIGATWAALNSSVRDYFSGDDGSSYYLLKYENLVAAPPEELERLCNWIGVGFDESMLAGVGEYHGRNRGVDMMSFSEDSERRAVMHIAGPEALHYGYAN